jgi:hypothetical protein
VQAYFSGFSVSDFSSCIFASKLLLLRQFQGFNKLKNGRSIKRGTQPDKIGAINSADNKSDENGKRRKTQARTGFHYPDAPLRAKAAGNAEQYCEQY